MHLGRPSASVGRQGADCCARVSLVCATLLQQLVLLCSFIVMQYFCAVAPPCAAGSCNLNPTAEPALISVPPSADSWRHFSQTSLRVPHPIPLPSPSVSARHWGVPYTLLQHGRPAPTHEGGIAPEKKGRKNSSIGDPSNVVDSLQREAMQKQAGGRGKGQEHWEESNSKQFARSGCSGWATAPPGATKWAGIYTTRLLQQQQADGGIRQLLLLLQCARAQSSSSMSPCLKPVRCSRLFWPMM